MKVHVTYQEVVNRSVIVEVDDLADVLVAYLAHPGPVSEDVIERECLAEVVIDAREVVLPDVPVKPRPEEEW